MSANGANNLADLRNVLLTVVAEEGDIGVELSDYCTEVRLTATSADSGASVSVAMCREDAITLATSLLMMAEAAQWKGKL